MSEIVIPLELPLTLNYSELREFAETACRNATLLEKHDIALEMGAEEETKVPKKRAQSTTASLLEAYDILEEYGGSLNATPEELHNAVVNLLLLEIQNPDPRQRLQAIVHLGKVTEVGTFSEKKEVTITHQNAADLKHKLKEQLLELKQNLDGVYEVKK